MQYLKHEANAKCHGYNKERNESFLSDFKNEALFTLIHLESLKVSVF